MFFSRQQHSLTELIAVPYSPVGCVDVDAVPWPVPIKIKRRVCADIDIVQSRPIS